MQASNLNVLFIILSVIIVAEYFYWNFIEPNYSTNKVGDVKALVDNTTENNSASSRAYSTSVDYSSYSTYTKSNIKLSIASLLAPINDSLTLIADLDNVSIPSRTRNILLPSCPALPPNLVGRINVNLDNVSWEELDGLYANLEPGGHGKPENCSSLDKVAIILPYRSRDNDLRMFLRHMHSFLTRQQLDYGIFVVEQVDNQTFNRAKLFNVGYVEAKKLYDWQCFIFHDVDLLPEDDRNLYSCPEQPRHMSVAIDKFNYTLPYERIFGGVSALTVGQFEKLNGFSNDYWGHGAEDDDMASRLSNHNLELSRYPPEVARYKMSKHKLEEMNAINQCRFSLMYKTKERMARDGLSNLNYNLIGIKIERLFTRITVDLMENQSKAQLAKERICARIKNAKDVYTRTVQPRITVGYSNEKRSFPRR